MADTPKIIPFRGKVPALAGEPTLESLDRHELMLEELRAELRGELFSLNKVNGECVRTLQVHHTALVELTAVLHDLQQRSWRGRWARFVRWCEQLAAHVEAYAIALGAADPFDVPLPLSSPADPLRGTAPDPARPDLDNPEAMPKP